MVAQTACEVRMTHANWIVCLAVAAGPLTAQVSYQRLLQAGTEPQNWLTYSGSYKSWRYSALNQINRQNASTLKLAWVYQMVTIHKVETTPLVVDGVMYLSE